MAREDKYNNILQASAEQRDQAKQRLYALMQARQRYTNNLRTRLEDEMQKAEKQREFQGILNVAGSALTGAGAGFLTGGPIGAAIGGGIGLAQGLTGNANTGLPLMAGEIARSLPQGRKLQDFDLGLPSLKLQEPSLGGSAPYKGTFTDELSLDSDFDFLDLTKKKKKKLSLGEFNLNLDKE